MQCVRKLFVQKIYQLQCLPLVGQHSCNLFTRPSAERTIHKWKFTYSQVSCKPGCGFAVLIRPLLIRHCSTNLASESTKPILLYRGEQKRLFQFLSFFAISQMVFWGYLTHVAFSSMKDSNMKLQIKYGPEGPPPELRSWRTWEGIKTNMTASRWRYGITILSMVTGTTIFFLSFLYSRKNINALVLREGGKHLTFKTYGIFAQGYTFTVPVRNVSCEYNRHGQRRTLPIKVKDHRMFYTLDTGDGKFYNGRLFDSFVTIKRQF